MATEIAFLPLKAGSRLNDPETSEGTVWQECLTTVLGQEGAQRAYWGTGLEDASMLYLFIDWDTVDHHKRFIDSREYGPFVKNLGTIMSGPPKFFHTHFTPHPASAALSDTNAPVTEIVRWYIDPSADTSKVESNVKDLVKVIEANATGYKGSAGGWSVEEVESPNGGHKCKIYAAVLGWESKEAHMNFRETQHFKDNAHLIKELPGLKDASMEHAKLQEITGGGTSVGAAGGLGADERGAPMTNPVQGEVLNPQAGQQEPPKTRSDGTTVKHNDDLKGAANEVHKERAGRGPYHHSVNQGN